MDKTAYISKLKEVFCESYKNGKKYQEVWLSEVDFGGLYHSDKHDINVKLEYKIISLANEIKEIIALLSNKANQELKNILAVNVFSVDEDVHCGREEILIFNEANACV